MSNNPHRQFHYGTVAAGTVTAVHPVSDNQRQLLVDVLRHDKKSAHFSVPYFTQPGLTRLPRVGMSVALLYVEGSPQLSLAFAHTFNQDAPTGVYADPLTPYFQFPDDLVLHHEETRAFVRFRNTKSSATAVGVDGSPCLFEITFNSGMMFTLTEQPPDAPATPPPTPLLGQPPPPPPKPTRVNAVATFPSGTVVKIEEPVTGQAKLSISMPSGFSLTIDEKGVVAMSAPGNVTMSSSGTFLVQSTDVQLGDSNGNRLAFLSDVQAVKSSFDGHVHSGVQGGPSTTAVPTAPMTAPIGTKKVSAV